MILQQPISGKGISPTTSVWLLLFLFFSSSMTAQTDRYWSHNFNDASSMLAGAVVGGGAGISAIYYNPANISEITQSNLSITASLFSYNFYDYQNALGDGIDLQLSHITVEPRFVSYMIQPKNNERLSIELASMNIENTYQHYIQTVDQHIDILENLPGKEDYSATYTYKNQYRDDYVGIGVSYKLTDRLWLGGSMFVSLKSLRYSESISIDAFPVNQAVLDSIPFYTASYENRNSVRYDQLSIIWHFGVSYKINNVSLGLKLATPGFQVYQGGKNVVKKIKQSNITKPGSSEFLPNYLIGDNQQGKQLNLHIKTPFSIAAGATFHSPKDIQKSFYVSLEYFSSITPYIFLEAEDSRVSINNDLIQVDSVNMLSYATGARDLFNLAIGYQWKISKNTLLLTGFKTNFNYLKGVDYYTAEGLNVTDKINYNVYHITGGLRFKLLKHVLMVGLQQSIGVEPNQPQIINLSDPVEFNTVEMAPLQGNREDNMLVFYNGLSIFLGAIFSLGGAE